MEPVNSELNYRDKIIHEAKEEGYIDQECFLSVYQEQTQKEISEDLKIELKHSISRPIFRGWKKILGLRCCVVCKINIRCLHWYRFMKT